jgi:hypothetical protein
MDRGAVSKASDTANIRLETLANAGSRDHVFRAAIRGCENQMGGAVEGQRWPVGGLIQNHQGQVQVAARQNLTRG